MLDEELHDAQVSDSLTVHAHVSQTPVPRSTTRLSATAQLVRNVRTPTASAGCQPAPIPKRFRVEPNQGDGSVSVDTNGVPTEQQQQQPQPPQQREEEENESESLKPRLSRRRGADADDATGRVKARGGGSLLSGQKDVEGKTSDDDGWKENHKPNKMTVSSRWFGLLSVLLFVFGVGMFIAALLR